jgi:Vitamin K-dependent gamma-carboxylase
VRFRRDSPRLGDPRGGDHAGLALFSVMWALAAVWHLLGNTAVGAGWAQAVLALGAGLVLWRPGSTLPLSVLAVGGLLTLWVEAPVVGNHWVLAGFVDLAILMAAATAALRRRWNDPVDLAERLFPVARLCLLGFYAFAAFAKLNSAFFDRSTSCAVHYFRESTQSLGLSSLQLSGAAWLQWAVIVGTAVIELAIPVLLVARRTRHFGVVLGVVFHAILALDRDHQFFDFSAVLVALFVLFLPPTAGTWVAERIGSIRARLALADERLPAVVHAAVAAIVAVAGLAVATNMVDADRGLELGWWTWQVWIVVCVIATLRFLDQRPPAPAPRVLRPHHALFLLVPLLVVANGLTPYLELKTGYGWNMYSNLRTVDGDSNHFVVRATLPLTDQQADLVHILDTDDLGLARYEERGYALTFDQLRSYLAERPDVRITYRRGNEVVALWHASDRPELVAPLPVWREKLQLFRAVDLRSPERCVPAFGPAR